MSSALHHHSFRAAGVKCYDFFTCDVREGETLTFIRSLTRSANLLSNRRPRGIKLSSPRGDQLRRQQDEIPEGGVDGVVRGDRFISSSRETLEARNSIRMTVFNIIYRVTIPFVQNLLLTSKQKFHFGLARPGQAMSKQNICFEVNRRF